MENFYVFVEVLKNIFRIFLETSIIYYKNLIFFCFFIIALFIFLTIFKKNDPPK